LRLPATFVTAKLIRYDISQGRRVCNNKPTAHGLSQAASAFPCDILVSCASDQVQHFSMRSSPAIELM